MKDPALGGSQYKGVRKITTFTTKSSQLADYRLGEIRLNSTYFESMDAFAENIKKYKFSSFVNHPVKALDHEIGHAYGMNWHGKTGSLYKKGEKVYKELEHDVLSRYAMTNSAELVAESFSAYVNYGKLPESLNGLLPIFKEILGQ